MEVNYLLEIQVAWRIDILQYLKPEVDDSLICQVRDGRVHWKIRVKKNLQDCEVAEFQSLVGMFYK